MPVFHYSFLARFVRFDGDSFISQLTRSRGTPSKNPREGGGRRDTTRRRDIDKKTDQFVFFLSKREVRVARTSIGVEVGSSCDPPSPLTPPSSLTPQQRTVRKKTGRSNTTTKEEDNKKRENTGRPSVRVFSSQGGEVSRG